MPFLTDSTAIKKVLCCFGMAILLAIGTRPAFTDARIIKTMSGPVLSVNGVNTAPAIFQIGMRDNLGPGQSETSWAASYGVSIVSPTLWGMRWFQDGENPSLEVERTVRWMDAVLKANPNALLIPRFCVDDPPAWWVEKHPNEITLFQDGSKGTASVHSQVWRRDAAKQIGSFVRLLEEKYGDHVIGYHVCGGNSAEWFYGGFWSDNYSGFERPSVDGFRQYLKTKYGTDAALRSAWHDPSVGLDSAEVPGVSERTSSAAESFRDPRLQQKAIDFDEFQNIDMADAVALMCKAVKNAAPNKLAIAFYGYTFEMNGSLKRRASKSGHLALSHLLKSPYVDGLAGPYSYGSRDPGDTGAFMGPVDSVLSSGKMWFTEDDTRTFLSSDPEHIGQCSDLRQSTGVLTRNFVHILTRGAGLWWMDGTGTGEFGSEDLWKHNGALTDVYRRQMPLTKYKPDVAVIIDEESCMYTNPVVGCSLLDRFRHQWYRLGAPVGIYLLDDLLNGRVPPARMYILLNLFTLDDSQLSTIRKNICNENRVIVWMYAPGIIHDSSVSPDNVSKVVGISLKEIITGDGNMVIDGTGAKFSAEHPHLSPTLAVSDTGASSIARYLRTDGNAGDVAIAEKPMKGYTSVYCGTLQLPAGVLRSLGVKAGVHIYNDQDQVIMAGNGFVALHATSSGPQTVRLPYECLACDALTDAKLGKNSIFTFDMNVGDTKLLRVPASPAPH